MALTPDRASNLEAWSEGNRNAGVQPERSCRLRLPELDSQAAQPSGRCCARTRSLRCCWSRGQRPRHCHGRTAPSDPQQSSRAGPVILSANFALYGDMSNRMLVGRAAENSEIGRHAGQNLVFIHALCVSALRALDRGAAISGCRQVYKPGHRVPKAGVMLMDLQTSPIAQPEQDLRSRARSQKAGGRARCLDHALPRGAIPSPAPTWVGSTGLRR